MTETEKKKLYYFETYIGSGQEQRMNFAATIDYNDFVTKLSNSELVKNDTTNCSLDESLMFEVVVDGNHEEIVLNLTNENRCEIFTEEGRSGFSLISSEDAKIIVAMAEMDNEY